MNSASIADDWLVVATTRTIIPWQSLLDDIDRFTPERRLATSVTASSLTSDPTKC
jgi:hypothetical protein